MDADTWGTTDDWAAMLAAARDVPGRRKFRLWCVAWARVIVAAGDAGRFPWARRWFGPDQLAGYARKVDAAEAFADRRISGRQLDAARAGPGGPHSVFQLPVRLLYGSDAEVERPLREFAEEFGLPTDRQLADLLREVFGNPFRPVAFDPEWRTSATIALARAMYDARDFAPMSVLADALDDAGCTDRAVIGHCRGPGPHVRGCWVVDAVLGLS